MRQPTGRDTSAVTAESILADIDARATVQALHGVDDASQVAWDGEPTPLSARWMRPVFPVDALPDWVADQVTAVAEATQTPLDLPGCVALACLSTAAGGKAQVEARPGWVEPANLYLAVAMPPGSRKSAVFRDITAPLLAAEQHLVEQARPVIADAELQARVAKARAERAARAAENATSEEARTTALAEASDAAVAENEVAIPPVPRLVADDVTPEAAATLLAEQDGRLAVLSAEGGIFGTLAGRYSAGPNLEVFLKGHAGDLLRVDRKGRPAEHVEHPALTLGLAVQPEVLRDIATMPGFRGRGLLARILYALPADTVGRRRIAPPPVPTDVADEYGVQLATLVASLHDLAGPTRLSLASEAGVRLQQFEAELEPQLGEHGQLAHVTDWASKLAGATVRIAGLIHLADRFRSGWAAPISADTVEAAVRVARYYLAHALAVFDNVMGADPVVDDARAILDWITRHGRHEFTRRDLYVSVHSSRWRQVADLDPGLTVLEQHGHIARLGTTPGPRGGRPSVRYAVHPSVVPTKPTKPSEPGDQQ